MIQLKNSGKLQKKNNIAKKQKSIHHTKKKELPQ